MVQQAWYDPFGSSSFTSRSRKSPRNSLSSRLTHDTPAHDLFSSSRFIRYDSSRRCTVPSRPNSVKLLPSFLYSKPYHPLLSSRRPPVLPPTSTPTSPALLPPAPAPGKHPRRPQKGRSITNNSFRPHVLAADRLSTWQSTYSIAHIAHLSSRYPRPLVELAKSVTRHHAPSTRGTYGAGLLRYHQFCDKWGISEHHRMPADYALLAAFVGEWKGRVSGRTIRSWLSAVAAWHDINHAPWAGDDKWVKMARKTANKEGTAHSREARAPVSIEHLLVLRHAIDITRPMHAAVWAAATVTFFGCRRLGETLVVSATDFDPKRHVRRSSEYVLLLNGRSALLLTAI